MRALIGGAALAVAAGCGSVPPPTELTEARRVYQEGVDGAAAELAPVELDESRQALERAEASFEDDPEAPATRDLSYIALRKAERARAQADIAIANRQTAEHRRAQEELEAEYLRRTRRQLSLTQEQLEEERRRLQSSQQEIERRDEQIEQQTEALETERAARERAEREAAAALASLREVAQVAEEQRGIVITLSGAVMFRSGSSELLPIAQQKLDQVAQMLNEHGNRTILVEGHTDSRGSRRTNARLSQQRADTVREYLVSKGVSADRIRAQGIGPDRPVADNSTPEGRANNRRVEIIVEPER